MQVTIVWRKSVQILKVGRGTTVVDNHNLIQLRNCLGAWNPNINYNHLPICMCKLAVTAINGFAHVTILVSDRLKD